MTAADWIAKRRELLSEFRKPSHGREMDSTGLAILGHEDFPRALDALEKVLEKVQPHRRIVMPGGSVDEHDYVGELADDIEQLITKALGVDS